MTCSPKRNNPYGIAPQRENDGHKAPMQYSDGEYPFLVALRRRNLKMGGLEDEIDIEKVETVFFKV
jgi:hypothetical protein